MVPSAAIVIADLCGTGGAREREPYGSRRDADQNLDDDIAKDTAHENLLARLPPVAPDPLSVLSQLRAPRLVPEACPAYGAAPIKSPALTPFYRIAV